MGVRTENPLAPRGFAIPSLNGVRALAVAIVFFGHGFGVPGAFPGHLGVTIFFFLSGYLITTLLRREFARSGRISLKAFYLRRVLRIVPPAYLAILFAIILGLTGVLTARMSVWGILSEFLYYTNYYIAYSGVASLPPETSMLWSLAIEEHFYLIIPGLLLVAFNIDWGRRRIGLVLLGFAIAITIWRIYLLADGADFYRLYVSTDTRMDSMLFGSAMALLSNPALGDATPQWRKFNFGSRYFALAATAAIVIVAFIPVRSIRFSLADTLIAACLYVIFWFIISSPDGVAGRLLNCRVVAHIGVLSYSIYLFHRLMLGLSGEWFGRSVLANLSALVMTILVAQVIYIAVERPSANLRRRLEGKG
ncbi:MAG: acyltransferase [Gordonia sp. (in: high G+C Gram-positive bacteria)]|nr:MAG: acyltransferase [Gordonia sp. (in: high G+C Gram-positive bacteria)]